ncbi:hypothetical protein RCG03_06590 [Proteus mirabilis]|nr:hypothetical protein [Proteus mirabilis]ELR5133776.1 hypothetical protein [Providencia rettgeri]ELR5136169.1 hypothetical protein [Providencia rettgeri]MDQ6455517.1 hypothetical protein [Proteus mirabilis]
MRKVSIEQIDNLIRSVKLGKNRVGQKMVARFDKLAFVTTCEPKYLERIYKSLERVITNDVFQVKTYIPIGDMGELYHSAIYIKNKKKPHQYVVIHYHPTGKGKRGEFRVEFSPQHFRKKELNALFMWLGSEPLLGEYLFKLLKSAWVTRIDYALDTYGLNIDDYFIHLKSASKGKVNKNSSDGGYGINLGSRNSEVYASVYTKCDVGDDISDIAEEVDELGNVLVDVEQYPKFLRIELRYQPKKQKLLLSKINNMTNLLEKVIFIDTKVISELSALVPDYKELTLPEIKAYIKEKYPNKVLKKFDRLLKKHNVSLINNKKLWGKLYLLIDKLGILGVPALWQKSLREEWARKHGY